MMKPTVQAFGLACAILAGASAQAQERKLTGAEIQRVLSGNLALGDEDGKPNEQLFLPNGATFYSVGTAQSQGQWTVRGDQYCSQWPPTQSWSCYDMTQEGPLYTFIASNGKRYVVRIR